MLCSSQPNREFARAPARIFVWRQSLRVGARADGTDPYGKSEPLQSARGVPRRRGVPAAQRSRRREALPRGGRCGLARRGRRGLWAGPKCPGCGAWRDSFIAAGVPKWRCRCCGGRLTSLTSAILEHCRKALPVWVTFIRLMRPIVPVECAAELFGVTHKTAFEWRHRVLATVSGFQDRTVLRDTVWVDERYINDTTSPKATGSPASAAYSTRSSAPASPSTFKMNPDAVACGHGKLSSARMRGP